MNNVNLDIIVSFDIKSLFTEVPTNKTLKMVGTKLEKRNTLAWIILSVYVIIEMFGTCINTTYFQVDNKFYHKKFGMAMGSPLSSPLSDIFMEDFEKRTLDQYYSRPKL